jgi:hypothetical protein
MTEPAPIDLSKISVKSNAAKAAKAWDGKKLVDAGKYGKGFASLPVSQQQKVIDYTVNIGFQPSQAKSVWAQLVSGSTQALAQGQKSSPWDIMNKNIAGGLNFGKLPVQYQTQYSNSVADALVRSAYSKVFDRIPTALDMSAPSTIKDAKGNPLTWTQALMQEMANPENQKKVTYVQDAAGNYKQVITQEAVDPATWLQNQMMTSYADAIRQGQLPPEAKILDAYNALAADYGYQTIDPATQKLNGNALIDLAGLEAGTSTLDQLKQSWANAAKAQYSHLAPALDSGLSLKQIAGPGISIIAKKMGLNPALVTVNNPMVQKWLKGDGKNTMTDQQTVAMIQQDPEWAKTSDATQTFDSLSTDILKRFGMIG